MRVSLRLMAMLTAAGLTQGLKPALLALLPPIPLYRRLFRTHRQFLTREMRLIGDEYIKHEFCEHQRIENSMHIVGFLTEWQLYAQKIEGDSWLGDKLNQAKIDKMSDQQIGQLYKLMQALQRKSRDASDEGSIRSLKHQTDFL